MVVQGQWKGKQNRNVKNGNSKLNINAHTSIEVYVMLKLRDPLGRELLRERTREGQRKRGKHGCNLIRQSTVHMSSLVYLIINLRKIVSQIMAKSLESDELVRAIDKCEVFLEHKCFKGTSHS